MSQVCDGLIEFYFDFRQRLFVPAATPLRRTRSLSARAVKETCPFSRARAAPQSETIHEPRAVIEAEGPARQHQRPRARKEEKLYHVNGS